MQIAHYAVTMYLLVNHLLLYTFVIDHLLMLVVEVDILVFLQKVVL